MRSFAKLVLACLVVLAMPASASASDNARHLVRGVLATEAHAPVQVESASDDDIPGVLAPPSPFSGTLDGTTDVVDVYGLWVTAGDEIYVSLTGDSATDFDVVLYGPDTVSVWGGAFICVSPGTDYPKVVYHRAPTSGYYYIAVYAPVARLGSYTVTYGDPPPDPDDDIPGVAAPDYYYPKPIEGTLDEAIDTDDVFSTHLDAGETLSLSLTGAADTDFDLYVYGPDAPSIWTGEPVAEAAGQEYPEILTYKAPAPGTYYFNANASSGSGSYSLSYSKQEEMVSPLLPLYRFYNKKNGSHFYTASLSEKNNVIANLSATYSYDGPAYNVCRLYFGGGQTVYRFYNKKNGSHFYTASEAEKNSVFQNLWATYTFDGPAFYINSDPFPPFIP